ncbi:MAG: SurA N-terminal domain-containing protein [Hyphomicrobium sp.]|nr:SurA N-terminal domain-containing protein [Hyphomicrobium sp.]
MRAVKRPYLLMIAVLGVVTGATPLVTLRGAHAQGYDGITVTIPPSGDDGSVTTTSPTPPPAPPAAKPRENSTLPEIVVPNREGAAGDDAKPAPKKAADPAAKKQTPSKSAAIRPDDQGGPGKVKGGGQSIAVLVNDEPITGYEITMRQRMMGMGSNIGPKAEANFKALLKSPQTNERWKKIVEATVKSNQGKSREEIMAILDGKRKEFGKSLQQQAIESARQSVAPGLRNQALEELIEERLKIQEAKRLNLLASDDEIDQSIKMVAEKNKMTEKEFGEYLKKIGADVNIMRERFRANISWQQVIRRRFGSQVSVTERDIDRFVEKLPGTGNESVELQVQKITVSVPPKLDQKGLAQRMADADTIARKGGGCGSMAQHASEVAGAKFENLGPRPAGSIPEPTRSLLLNSADGELLPPFVGAAGIEIWAVCSRKTLAADMEKRQTAQAELRQTEFEILAKKHLKDLRQDASIEYR